MRQQQKLQILNDYCHQNSYKFLLEVLISPTEQQLNNVGGNIEIYDRETRPNLTAKSIEELQNSNIEPDVWKIEGMETEDSYKIVSIQARKEARSNVGIVILGRAENAEKVEKWIEVGRKINGIIGFAVGRTIFWQPLIEYKNGRMGEEDTIQSIKNGFLHFYNIFNKK